jgi:signal transduction histidine kinase
MIAGLLVAGGGSFELERFVIRSGHLVILSLLLIWFGFHQRATQLSIRVEDFERSLAEKQNPLARALELPMEVSRANGGALLVAPVGEEPCDGLIVQAGKQRMFNAEHAFVRDEAHTTFLCDLGRNRAVTRLAESQFQFLVASDLLDMDCLRELGIDQGLVAEVRTGTVQGWLLLWGIPDLSTDFIDLGRELGRAAGTILDRHALLEAIESGAAARTRLSLARDVHDSIVQFLAGTSFRVEAIKRAAKSGSAVGDELEELKRLLLEEQGEIRGFVNALRRDRPVELAESVAELRALAKRLSQQWSVVCRISADDEPASIPIRLHFDLQQLLREAVANAVRHGGADRIDVGLAVEADRLQLSVADNGTGFPQNGAASEPWSLKERVERAHGSIRLVSEPGSTNVLISLPLAGAAA